MEQLTKNQTYTAEIIGYSSTGAGVCRIMGRAVFVERALMGEVWDILIVKLTSSVVYGKGIKLIKSSPARAEPVCPLFGKCGGCDLLHMSYDEEKRFKLSRVNDALSRIGGLDFQISEIIGADESHRLRYRNKAIYAVSADENGKAVTGFYRERSHDVIFAQDCQIQTHLSVCCAEALRRFMDSTGVLPFDEKTGKGQIRHLYTRCSVNFPQSVACLVSAKGLHEHTQALISELRSSCPQLTGIVLCINRSFGNTVLSGEYHTLWGSDIIEDELCSLHFRISPASFYQINPPQAERLYEKAVEYASSDVDGTVLDLYCGTGTISLCLARRAKEVIGTEIVQSAVENARRNAADNGIENVRFILGDAASAAKQLEQSGVRPCAVVVDPPRKGLTPEVIETIVNMSPLRVVYVSCDPGTLSRDLKHFSALGYAPTAGTAVDMFPKTAHVETVILLERKDI